MRILFCGVGALGSQAALLCRSLPVTLALVDFDRVAQKNLAAQAHGKASLGKNKAEALKAQLFALHGAKAEAFPVRLGPDNVVQLCRDAGLLVDAFDNAASRRLLSSHARAVGLPLVHAAVAADGTFGLVRWDERFVPDEEDAPGQPTCEGGEHLPLYGLLAATLARTIQDFVRDGQRRDSLVGLRAITVTGGV